MLKRRSLYGVLLLVFVLWNGLTYYYLHTERGDEKVTNVQDIENRLQELEEKLKIQAEGHQQILNDIKAAEKNVFGPLLASDPAKRKQLLGLLDKLRHSIHSPVNSQPPQKVPAIPVHEPAAVVPVHDALRPPSIHKVTLGQLSDSVVLPVLVIACNRPTVRQNLDELIRYRPSQTKFPIIVSLDCGHSTTKEVIQSYGSKVRLIEQPNLSDIPLPQKQKKFLDDLSISPDFFEFFESAYPLLLADPTLWCISAWNDNGKSELISDEAALLYRTDFFPGLGWLLQSTVWDELEPRWPPAFWDDWMRQPAQRKDRACIRPEVPRSSTFGRIGVSKGQFFDKYLRYIKHYNKFVPFKKMDLSFLLKSNYDELFVKQVYGAKLISVDDVLAGKFPESGAWRVQYDSRKDYKTLSKRLGLMDDLKSGVPRAAYRGVVSLWKNGHRIYLAPPHTWTKYDTSWV